MNKRQKHRKTMKLIKLKRFKSKINKIITSGKIIKWDKTQRNSIKWTNKMQKIDKTLHCPHTIKLKYKSNKTAKIHIKSTLCGVERQRKEVGFKKRFKMGECSGFSYVQWQSIPQFRSCHCKCSLPLSCNSPKNVMSPLCSLNSTGYFRVSPLYSLLSYWW